MGHGIHQRLPQCRRRIVVEVHALQSIVARLELVVRLKEFVGAIELGQKGSGVLFAFQKSVALVIVKGGRFEKGGALIREKERKIRETGLADKPHGAHRALIERHPAIGELLRDIVEGQLLA